MLDNMLDDMQLVKYNMQLVKLRRRKKRNVVLVSVFMDSEEADKMINENYAKHVWDLVMMRDYYGYYYVRYKSCNYIYFERYNKRDYILFKFNVYNI